MNFTARTEESFVCCAGVCGVHHYGWFGRSRSHGYRRLRYIRKLGGRGIHCPGAGCLDVGDVRTPKCTTMDSRKLTRRSYDKGCMLLPICIQSIAVWSASTLARHRGGKNKLYVPLNDLRSRNPSGLAGSRVACTAIFKYTWLPRVLRLTDI